MKKIFSAFLICFSALLCAENEPVFEKTDQTPQLRPYACPTFSLPVDEQDELPVVNENENGTLTAPRAAWLNPSYNPYAQYTHWHRYKTDYGNERIVLRFPNDPKITRTSTMVKAFAHDGLIYYSLDGYFPPAHGIIPSLWFDELLTGCNSYPYVLKSYTHLNPEPGVYILDYVAYDMVQNCTLKSRAIVTPLNGYILQCYKPNGMKDAFRYFVDNFSIRY